MVSIFRKRRCMAALAIWAAGLGIFLAFALWNIKTYKLDDENRLIGEAGRTAAQLASMLSLPGWSLDAATADAVIAGAMEDDRIYAVRINSDNGVSEGQRRNYLWEPVPWDDEITENCAQGMNPVKIGGEIAGSVDVWLSSRLNEEEYSLFVQREWLRFICFLVLWSSALLLVLWQWGDLRHLKKYFLPAEQKEQAPRENDVPEKIILGLCQPEKEDTPEPEKAIEEPHGVVDAEKGRKYQSLHPESYLVTAGMFRQTFARGPALISRLYAEGETAGLCHLGRILEQAAPCIGADRLATTARHMQKALNDPECDARALPVEECASALEDVLNALCGNGQWRSRA